MGNDESEYLGMARHLNEAPTDWPVRLQLADWHDDRGEGDKATFQRWLVRWEVAPEFYGNVWGWYECQSDWELGGRANLPVVLLKYMYHSSYPAQGGRERAESELWHVIKGLGYEVADAEMAMIRKPPAAVGADWAQVVGALPAPLEQQK